MTKKSGTFIFIDKEKLVEMLGLRRAGWTFVALAEFYNCDRTSIRYQCRKYQIFPTKTEFISNSSEVFNPKRIATQIVVKIVPHKISNWVIVDGERINTGKSYADYLKNISPYKERV